LQESTFLEQQACQGHGEKAGDRVGLQIFKGLADHMKFLGELGVVVHACNPSTPYNENSQAL
jgi:hypothetical protein